MRRDLHFYAILPASSFPYAYFYLQKFLSNICVNIYINFNYTVRYELSSKCGKKGIYTMHTFNCIEE